MVDFQGKQHVVGLDALRFIAAAWVALSHGARLPIDRITDHTGFWRALGSLNNGLFNGVAAVMVFFVISGLVIHLPQADGQPLNPFAHWLRRLTRIIPPVLVMTMIVNLFGEAQSAALRGILWSIWCEIAYYIMYPAMLVVFHRYSTRRAFFGATAVSLAAILMTWPTSYHSELALAPLVAIGLPSWVLGCLLAERVVKRQSVNTDHIWLWRAAALVLSVIMKMPVTHGPLLVGYPAGHWLFAIFAAFWIEREIAWFRRRPPSPALESLGAMSYSLYLVHMPVIVACSAVSAFMFLSLPQPLGELLRWSATVAAIAIATLAFYILVEAPSHRLARAFGQRIANSTLQHRGLIIAKS